MHKSIITLAVLGILYTSTITHADTGVTVTFDDPRGIAAAYHDDIERLLTAAVHEWTQYLAGSGSLQIKVSVDRTGSFIMYASAGASVYQYNSGGLSVYDWSVSHEICTGLDDNGSGPDAYITINPDYLGDLYFDPDEVLSTDYIPPDKYDAFSVLVHEFGHAIAFAGWYQSDSAKAILSEFDDYGNPVPPGQLSRAYVADEETQAVRCEKCVTDSSARLAPTGGSISLFDEHISQSGNVVRFVGPRSQEVAAGGVVLDAYSHYHTNDRESVMNTFARRGKRGCLKSAEVAILEDLGMPMSGLVPPDGGGGAIDPCLVDSDGDSLGDCNDECPYNYNLTEAGPCGCDACPGDPDYGDSGSTSGDADDPSDNRVQGEAPPYAVVPACGASPGVMSMLMFGSLVACFQVRRKNRGSL